MTVAAANFSRISPISYWLLIVALWSAPTSGRAAAHPAEQIIERATMAMRIDPEASRAGAESALESLRRKPDADLEIRARLLLCDYQSERDHTAAVKQLEFTIALLPQAKRRGLRAGILNCQGDIAEAGGDLDKAESFLEQAVSAATAENDDEMLANALFSRGSLVGIRGDFANGLSDLRRAQTLFERLKMPNHALTVHNNIAILYSRMGDYAKALEIYQSAVKAQRRAGMRRDVALTLHNIGRTHEHMRQWEAARQSFEESLVIASELRYVRGEAYALRGVAATMTAQGDSKDALRILDEAAALQKTIADASLGARITLERGRALRQQKRFNDALAALDEAKTYYQQADAVIELGATYDELAATHAALGAWRPAYEERARAQAIEQRLFRNRFDQQFATLRVEFDTAAKEKENAALLRENEANQKALVQARNVRTLQAIVIALAALLLVMLGAFAWRQRRRSLSMRSLAMTDELTGVANRRSALQKLETMLHANATTCSVCAIDIDHFKSINDKYGHPQGDIILRRVATKLNSVIAEPAFVGRLGGEEFIIVAPVESVQAARAAAEHYRVQIAGLDTHDVLGERTITVSVGVSISTPGVDTPITMLQRADAALYAAKHAGRNCVRTEADALGK